MGFTSLFKRCKLFIFVETFFLLVFLVSCEVSKEVLELPAIDEYIIMTLRETPEKRDDVLQALEHYRSVLYKVYRSVLHHDRWKIEDATYVYNKGEPKFLNEPIDMKALAKLYEWNQGHFTAIHLLKSEVKQFWDDFTRQYQLIKSLYKV